MRKEVALPRQAATRGAARRGPAHSGSFPRASCRWRGRKSPGTRGRRLDRSAVGDKSAAPLWASGGHAARAVGWRTLSVSNARKMASARCSSCSWVRRSEAARSARTHIVRNSSGERPKPSATSLNASHRASMSRLDTGARGGSGAGAQRGRELRRQRPQRLASAAARRGRARTVQEGRRLRYVGRLPDLLAHCARRAGESGDSEIRRFGVAAGVTLKRPPLR